MDDTLVFWLGVGFAIAGVGALRFSWGRSGRSALLNLAGWSLWLLAAICGASIAGAWGLAIVCAVGMAAASVLLIFAAAKPNAKRRSAQRILRVSAIGNPGEKTSTWHATATFLIVGPLCLAAAVIFALAARELIISLGGAEANGNVAVLGIVPLGWPILTFAIMTIRRRLHQLTLIFAIGAVSILLLLTWGAAA